MNSDQINLWCGRVMFFSLLPVAFFLPISTAAVEVGASVSIAAYFIKRFLLVFVAFRSCSQKTSSRRSFQDDLKILLPVPHFLVFPVLLLFFATFLSVLSSQFPYMSWKGFIGKTIEAVILFFATVECINSRKRLGLFLGILMFSAVVVSFDGIWQHFLKSELIFQKAITVEGRITGPFGHPNDYGSYLLTISAFFTGLLIWSWKKPSGQGLPYNLLFQGKFWAVIISIGTLISAIALGWTFSRGAWIGFACAMILLAFLFGKRWYIPIVFLLTFWVGFSSQLGTVRNVSFITDDISLDGRYKVKRLAIEKTSGEKRTPVQHYLDDVLSALSRFNWTGRQVFWAETFEVFKAAPVFGTGLNTYTDAVQRYNIPWSGYYSHNCYLQMLAETGIVGFSAFLWMMFVLSRESWRRYWKMPNGFYRVVLGGLFSGLVGFWVHGAMDTSFYSSRLANLMWIIMGLIVAVIRLEGQESLKTRG